MQRHIWKRTNPGSRCRNCGVTWRWLDTSERHDRRRMAWAWPDGGERIERPRAQGGRHWKCGERPEVSA